MKIVKNDSIGNQLIISISDILLAITLADFWTGCA